MEKIKDCLPGCCAECKHSLDIENDNFLECELDGKEYEVDYACETFEEE